MDDCCNGYTANRLAPKWSNEPNFRHLTKLIFANFHKTSYRTDCETMANWNTWRQQIPFSSPFLVPKSIISIYFCWPIQMETSLRSHCEAANSTIFWSFNFSIFFCWYISIFNSLFPKWSSWRIPFLSMKPNCSNRRKNYIANDLSIFPIPYYLQFIIIRARTVAASTPSHTHLYLAPKCDWPPKRLGSRVENHFGSHSTTKEEDPKGGQFAANENA